MYQRAGKLPNSRTQCLLQPIFEIFDRLRAVSRVLAGGLEERQYCIQPDLCQPMFLLSRSKEQTFRGLHRCPALSGRPQVESARSSKPLSHLPCKFPVSLRPVSDVRGPGGVVCSLVSLDEAALQLVAADHAGDALESDLYGREL